MSSALDDVTLTELFRLGGGLKGEFQSLVNDLRSPNIVYDKHVISMVERFEVLICGNNIKTVLDSRGRLSTLDKLRTLVVKLRGVPKGEIPGVLSSLMPDLVELVQIAEISAVFKQVVNECLTEMNAELERVKNQQLSASATASLAQGSQKTATASNPNNTASASRKKSTAEPAPAGTASRRSSTGKTGTAKSGTASDENAGFIDPTLVKQWNRKLGIIFYSSDLPMNVQEACATGVSSTRQQLECNRLIDIVVLDASKKILHHMNRKYGKLINSITSFMETQAEYVNTCAVNVAEFFLKIAKMVELHREEQTNLDNRNADELWDLSEDFRIEKEDREALFQQACQRIRESVSSQELNNNFEEVLDLLEKIQNSYRTYHSKACFSADKYPLILIDEYRNYLLKISATFLTLPVKNHNLLMNYNRVFDRVIRFNKKFFEADPRAAGVEPREVVPSEDIPTEGASSEVGVEGVSEVVNNPDDPPIEPVKVEEKEVYATPLDEASSEQQAFTGKYESISSFDSLIDGLMREADSTEPEDIAAPSSSFAAKGPTARADYPFLKDPNDKFNNITTTYLVSIPLLRDDYDALTDDDKDEYNDALQKLFIPLDDASVAALNPELVSVYNDCVACYNDTKAVYATTQEPDYIRAHPPTRVYSKTVIIPDKWGRKSTQVDTVEVSELWVLSLETERDDIKKVVSNIRESVTVAIEKESFQRLDYSEKNAASKKDEFTEELEDRLRTHWPRRGRVETQIKQPREAELLSHEDKTMRYIQSIQQRMYDSQKNFISVSANGKRKCDDYINDIASLKELLSGTFRNLASLQAIDVKARTFYLAFLKENQQILDQLNKICTDDSNNIITYALDFRKVCPPQAPDNPSGGGYSESEIKEIEILVHSQCDEIRVIIEEWKKDIIVLKEQQDISAKQQDEFTKLYEKCTQDVAMAEGLGQKYGAPRRRAQERIRTEISRDEKSASKVDNMLDELEKICQEVGNTKVDLLDGEEDEPNSVSFDVNNGKKELDKLKYTWNLMNNIRVAFHNRASYLRILEKVISTDKLSWMTAYRIPDTSDVTKDEDTEANDENTEKFGVKATFEEIIQEVDTACRKETKDLYESEGRGNLLADGGVPESLRVWLKETQEKLIGKNGHREKAWKRFWAQVEKFEIIVARKKLNDGNNNQNEEEEESKDEECGSIVPYPSPGICLKLLTDAFILYLKYECVNRQNSFTKLTRKLDKSRDQNERLLRPKLGSPDAVDELNALNETELDRSNEYVVGVKSYLSDCIIAITEHFKSYINDGTICSKGLISMLDSIVRLDILNVPPDTAVPTKRMSMKRLRKAQRLRQIVASGGEDRSRERVWPEISLSNISAFLVEFNNVVIKPEPVIDTTTPAVPTKGGKGQPAPVAAAVTDTFSLVPDEWLKLVGKDSAIKGAVSTAHRAFIKDRDIQVNRYLEVVTFTINDINAKCNRLLAEEKSWIERWKKQVDMLRTGNL